jgi:hypothetical protein
MLSPGKYGRQVSRQALTKEGMPKNRQNEHNQLEEKAVRQTIGIRQTSMQKI